MNLRCIIIDDEYLARRRLAKLLESFETLVVVGQCKNGKEALEKIHLKEPDLIFLDIQMPDMDGFTVVSKLQLAPYVIFTTAYDTYALKAFEINAVDYLLKPFDEDRLGIAIDRIMELKRKKKASNLEDKIKRLLLSYESQTSDFVNHFTIKTKGRDLTVYIDDVIYFKSDGNYVHIVTETKTYLFRITMNALFNSLDPTQFLKIHRALVVNKMYIKKCVYRSNNEYKFRLKNGEDLMSSRSYNALISEYISSREEQ